MHVARIVVSLLLLSVYCEGNLLQCCKLVLDTAMTYQSCLAYKTNNSRFVNGIIDVLPLKPLQMFNLESREAQNLAFTPFTFAIIVMDTEEDLLGLLDILKRQTVSNNKLKYFFVYLGAGRLKTFFAKADAAYMTMLLLLTRRGNAYTTNVLGATDATFMFSCSDPNVASIARVYKKLEDFRQYPLRVAVLIKPPFVVSPEEGIEISCLQAAAKKYNFSVVFYKEEFSILGFQLAPGKYTGVGKVLYENKCDLMMGLIRYNYSYAEDFDPTYPFMASSMSTFVPKALKLKEWRGILQVFTLDMWIYIAFSVLLVTLAFMLLGSYYNKEKGFNSLSYCTLTALALVIKHSISQPKYFKFRMVFISCVLYSCIVSSSFESTLLTFLIKPIYEHQIGTIDEAIAAGLVPQGNAITKQLFKGLYGNYIYKNWRTCYEPCFNSTSVRERRYAVIVNNELIKYQITVDLTEKERAQIYEIPGLLTYYTWMVMRKGFPLKAPLDKLLRQFREAGFLAQWSRDYRYVKPFEGPQTKKEITVGSLVVPFCIYGFGVTAAVVTFFAEISKK